MLPQLGETRRAGRSLTMDYEQAESELGAALRHLYKVFRTYHGSPGWDDPLNGFTPEHSALPAKLKVTELSHEDFTYFSWHAFTLCEMRPGHPLQYFLPRIIEYHTTDSRQRSLPVSGHLVVDLQMLISYMRQAQWRQWPAIEVAAVERWAAALFHAALLCPVDDRAWPDTWQRPVYRDPAECLEWAAELDVDVRPLLRLWDEDRSFEATLKLASFIADHAPTLADAGWPHGWRGYWSSTDHAAEAQVSAVVAWLLHPALRERLEAAFFDPACARAADEISRAVEFLDAVLSAWRNTTPPQGWPSWVATVLAMQA